MQMRSEDQYPDKGTCAAGKVGGLGVLQDFAGSSKYPFPEPVVRNPHARTRIQDRVLDAILFARFDNKEDQIKVGQADGKDREHDITELGRDVDGAHDGFRG